MQNVLEINQEYFFTIANKIKQFKNKPKIEH